jgi:hypothetical protein
VEEVGPLAEHVRLALALEPEALAQVDAADSRLERRELVALFALQIGEFHAGQTSLARDVSRADRGPRVVMASA